MKKGKMKNGVIALACSILLLASCSHSAEENKQLPVLGPKDMVKAEDGSMDTVYHTIADFAFVNQDSQVIDNAYYAGDIYVTDFFFTSCPTICPVMKKQMLRVYEAYKQDSNVFILSHTIDPEYDTVKLLHQYAKNLGVKSPKWNFVTGEKPEIYKMAQKSYLVSALEDNDAPGGFIHSGAFVLIDGQGRIRGIYDGTKAPEVDQLIKDIQVLKKEGHD